MANCREAKRTYSKALKIEKKRRDKQRRVRKYVLEHREYQYVTEKILRRQ